MVDAEEPHRVPAVVPGHDLGAESEETYNIEVEGAHTFFAVPEGRGAGRVGAQSDPFQSVPGTATGGEK
jgi:hypothetical protein